MKCKNCNSEVQETMKYCPFCSKELTEQINKRKRNNKIIVASIIFVTSITIIISQVILLNNQKKEVEGQLSDMVTSICNSEYAVVYETEEYKYQGIYECKNSNYVYYVNDTQSMCGLYKCGNIYEIGYVYHEDIENVFPNALYFYRESRVTTISNELKIALVAENENELINKYSEQLYQLIKNMNSKYKEDLRLNVYYNNTLSGVETTYDKLFLMAGFYSNNVTQSYGMGTGYGEYIFYDGDPMDLLNSIFVDPANYPANARNAIKFNRSINIEITDGQTITYEEFVTKINNSFEEGF